MITWNPGAALDGATAMYGPVGVGLGVRVGTGVGVGARVGTGVGVGARVGTGV